MGDLLDDLMRELRRRQAGGGAEPARNRRRGGPADSDIPEDESGDRPADGSADEGVPPRPTPSGRRAGADGGRRGTSAPATAPAWNWDFRRSGLLLVGPILVVALLALLTFGRSLIDLWSDVLWYRSVGYESVLWTRLGAQVGLFWLGALLGAAVLLGNLWLAGRLAVPPAGGSRGPFRGLLDRLTEAAEAERQRNANDWSQRGEVRTQGGLADLPDLPSLAPVGRILLAAFALLTVFAIAGGLASAWETILLWQQRVPFSPDGAAVTDPVFGRDISFFLFELPFLRLVQAVIVGMLISTLVLVAGRYLLTAVDRGLGLTTPVRLHFGILGGLALVALAYGYQLDKLELAYSTRSEMIGVVGVSYADANAQFFAYDLLTGVSALAAALLVGGAFARTIWPPAAALAVWFLASILVGGLYPEAIQRFVVRPNQLAQETPYIANNIAMTRLAFGFATPDGGAAWDDSRRYQGDQPLTQAAIDAEELTFGNARLWDYRPLGDTLDQLQTIRRYYDFTDVDTDRYLIDGVPRQVMLSARELDLAGNPDATGFVNERIIFTHGIGLAMVPVNEVASQGQPRLFIRNLPPTSTAGAPEITEPRIYFGERPSDYVVVGAKQAEFDYPRGEADPEEIDTGGVETNWSGRSGIALDSAINRFLFAVRFGDLDLLISDQITQNSQLLFHRSLGDRVPRLAPFLRYDRDPYIVINGVGRLFYLWDAYTTTDLFPHANPFNPGDLGNDTGLGGRPFNYIRNSVKVAVDAYHGTTTLYIAESADPLIRAWARVFPELFRPMSEMPPDLLEHVRVPEEGFNVQTRMFGRYHVANPATFFSSEDLWTVPTGQGSEQSLPSEAYYVIMRMPGETEAEFLLLQPMVPRERPNMIAWLAARSDGESYGDVRVYRFPVDTTVLGPAQIEARIDQDPQISAQVTLWSQAGSTVIRGNLIVVPVGDSLLYLQPVYLQSTASAFPEFQRIIVASPTEVVWASTLGESLRLLLEAQGDAGPSPGPSPPPTPSPGASPTPSPAVAPTPGPSPTATPGDEVPTEVAELIDFANAHFELAQEALRAGDFARYGEEIDLVEEALQRLDELTAPAGG